MASATSMRWRSLATRLKITPAMLHRRIVRGKAAHDGRRRLRLPRHVEDEDDRQAEMRGEIGGRAAPAVRPGGAVEQAHHAFDHDEIGVARGLRGQRIEQRRPASPRNRD